MSRFEKISFSIVSLIAVLVSFGGSFSAPIEKWSLGIFIIGFIGFLIGFYAYVFFKQRKKTNSDS